MDSDKIMIAAICCLPGVGGKTFTLIDKLCEELSITYNDFFYMSKEELKNNFTFLWKSTYDYLEKNRDELFEKVHQRISNLVKSGIEILARYDKNYPKKILAKLGDYAPPLIFARGNLNLLDMDSIGIVGSRKPSDEGIEFTKGFVEKSISKDKVIVSGYAKGIDYQAHLSALVNGGNTIFVLPSPILKFDNKILCELNSLNINFFDIENNFLIITEFLDYYSIHKRSMPILRNRIIVSLSNEICVVEAQLKSGTINTALTTKEFGIPLKVADYSKLKTNPEGNDQLIAMGTEVIDFFECAKKKNIVL